MVDRAVCGEELTPEKQEGPSFVLANTFALSIVLAYMFML